MLSEKSRSTLYQGLAPLVGEVAIAEMLSYFPARDVEEPVSQEFLRAELLLFRSELRTELRVEMAELSGGMKSELHRSMQHLTLSLVGTMVAIATLTVAIIALLH
ncbi:MAG TPA: hypothetical protein VID05_07590 [Acidimicrobiales bacterium]